MDPQTGEPLESQDRDGQPRKSWKEDQNQLLRILRNSSRHALNGKPDAGAHELEEFLESGERSATHFGIAAGRAAVLRRKEGNITRALELAEQALEREPDVVGHARLVIDLLTREGKWTEARRILESKPQIHMWQGEIRQDLFLGALIEGRTESAREFLAWKTALAPTADPIYYDPLLETLYFSHQGQPEEAEKNAKKIQGEDRDSLAFLLSALISATKNTPDYRAAEDFLAEAEKGNGDGQTLPFEPLRAFLRAKQHQPLGDPSVLEQAVADQETAGKENILDIYFVPWAHALAARAYLDASNPAAAAPHRRKAEETGHGAPFLKLIMENSPSRTGNGR